MKKPSEPDEIEPRDPRAYPKSPKRDPRAARITYIIETEELDPETGKPLPKKA